MDRKSLIVLRPTERIEERIYRRAKASIERGTAESERYKRQNNS